MFLALLAIFIIVPLLELWLIYTVGSEIGFLPTFLTLIVISALGAALAKQQGYRAVRRIQLEINQGRIPGDALLDGALVLAGALLLLTPGFITDVFGMLALLPPSRSLLRRWLRGRLRLAAQRRTLVFWPHGGRGRGDAAGGPPPGTGGYSEPEQRRKEIEP